MPAATLAEVRDGIAGFFHKANPDDPTNGIEAFWSKIIPPAMAKAEAWLRDNLPGSAEDVALYAMFKHYHLDLSKYWAVMDSLVALSDDQRVLLQKYDVREEVKALGWISVTQGVPTTAAGGSFQWTSEGTARNPLLTDPSPVRMGDTPFPGV